MSTTDPRSNPPERFIRASVVAPSEVRLVQGMWMPYFQRLLKSNFSDLQSRNSAFSMRAFARKLGVSAGTMSDLMKGKQVLSTVKAMAVAEKMGLQPAEVTRLGSLMGMAAPIQRPLLSDEAAEVISDVYAFAILALFDCDQAPADLAEIQERFRADQTPALKTSYELLLKHGLIRVGAGGCLEKTTEGLTTSDGPPRDVIRKKHAADLDRALTLLESIPAEERDYSSIVFAGDPAMLPQVREEIRLFRDRLSSLMSSQKKSDVFQLSLQLVPITRSEKK